MIETGPQAALAKLYAELPTITCQGKCFESCGPLAMSQLELDRLWAVSGRRPTYDPTTLRCNYLSAGRCSVYANRPLLCRLFGLDPKMACPHGCQPSRWLAPGEGGRWLARAAAIGGAVAMATPRREGSTPSTREEP